MQVQPVGSCQAHLPPPPQPTEQTWRVQNLIHEVLGLSSPLCLCIPKALHLRTGGSPLLPNHVAVCDQH